MKKTILCILAAIGLVGCAETPTVSVRRIEVEGDQAHYVGKRLVADLEMASVKITESAESAPVLKATSTIKKLEGGVRVFTLEITDGKGLNIKETMSTQDVTPFAGERSTRPQIRWRGNSGLLTRRFHRLLPARRKSTTVPVKQMSLSHPTRLWEMQLPSFTREWARIYSLSTRFSFYMLISGYQSGSNFIPRPQLGASRRSCR